MNLWFHTMSSLLENYDYIDELSILTIQKYNSLSLSQQISLTNAIDRLGNIYIILL